MEKYLWRVLENLKYVPMWTAEAACKLLLLKSSSFTDLFFFKPLIKSPKPLAGIIQLAKSNLSNSSEVVMSLAKIWHVETERVVSPWNERHPVTLRAKFEWAKFNICNTMECKLKTLAVSKLTPHFLWPFLPYVLVQDSAARTEPYIQHACFSFSVLQIMYWRD